MPTGRLPTRVAARIFRSLDDHAEKTGVGEAYPDGIGFAVPLLPSGRESFSPDASYYVGSFPRDPMRFIEGAPTFAVEVRSENDYGPAADAEFAQKRVDYFQAGTVVVWDVDPLGQTVSCYRSSAPTVPVRFDMADTAEGEPAVPGWRIAVDAIFR